ncbi:hypothetical protein RRG08_044196 [Elysia crispata]|uniref:Uncharacterized protein n=1 Tax=Elysia crispata TaxID=231223 RepID=A0AAE1CNS0_9GAST|nr:hypothetical protein RRG08_044196 [Elysia crispata]
MEKSPPPYATVDQGTPAGYATGYDQHPPAPQGGYAPPPAGYGQPPAGAYAPPPQGYYPPPQSRNSSSSRGADNSAAGRLHVLGGRVAYLSQSLSPHCILSNLEKALGSRCVADPSGHNTARHRQILLNLDGGMSEFSA